MPTTLPTTLPTTAPIDGPFIIGPVAVMLLAVPVLLMGEWLIRKVPLLNRLSIPAAVVGGLIVAALILAVRLLTNDAVLVRNATTNGFWNWFNTTQLHFNPLTNGTSVHTPLLAMFFTCVGLNASWAIAGKHSGKLALFLLLATVLAVAQYALGVGTALALGESPLLGLMCSGVALMGGFGTAAGFAQEFQKAGLPDASTIGVASAAFGVVVGGLIAGPLGTWIVNAFKLKSTDATTIEIDTQVDEGGFFSDLKNMSASLGSTLLLLFIVLVCMKAGQYVSEWIISTGTPLIRQIPGVSPSYKIAFPTYLGSMLLAVVVRNIHDFSGMKFIHTKHVDVVSSFVLAWLLTAVMIALTLRELSETAGAMLVILTAQVALMVVFCRWVVFYVMGKNYEAAAMSGGMVGFGLGATSNALASIKALSQRFGPAPQAVIIVSVVGAFLIDFINAILITIGLNIFAARQ
jgi:glutamate:Na+ symporter, ESS family